MDPSTNAQDVTTFIDQTEAWINKVLLKLNWSKDQLLQRESTSACPLDPGHGMAKQGRRKTDPSNESSKFYYENATKVKTIEIDQQVMWGILAQTTAATTDVSAGELSSAQRLSVYEYCMQQARDGQHETSIPVEHLQLLDDDTTDKKKSWLEVKAEERDQKRRRQSYKNKASVHTRNKSHTQIVREVIHGQTEILGRMWSRDSLTKRSAVASSDPSDRSTLASAAPTASRDPSPHARSQSRDRSKSSPPRERGQATDKKRSRERSLSDREESRKKHKSKHKKHKHKKSASSPSRSKHKDK